MIHFFLVEDKRHEKEHKNGMSIGANAGRMAKACSNNDGVDGTLVMFQTMILFTRSFIEQTDSSSKIRAFWLESLDG
jgi:hypothetical protein